MLPDIPTQRGTGPNPDQYDVQPKLCDKKVTLFDDVGFESSNFKNTILDDDAGTSIKNGSGPFTGIYKPEGALSDFDERDTAGEWELKIEDDWNGGTATLNSWRIVNSFCGVCAQRLVGHRYSNCKPN